MALREFSERCVKLSISQPFSLKDRPYLHALYRSRAKRIVIRASRQVEKSTYLVNRILYDAWRYPGLHILFVSPRQDQARMFSKVRLGGTIANSAILKRLLWSRKRPLPTMDLTFENTSRVFIRSAFHMADAIRGISASLLLIDEFQDLAAGELPVLEETLSHSKEARIVLTGTPKVIDNHLETTFANSTANEWQIVCTSCARSALMDENILGPCSLLCSHCQTPLDARQGRWVPRFADSAWGEGYWINHLMVPWINVADINARRDTYDSVRFRNEVLGLSTDLGDHMITRAEIEACCENRAMAQRLVDVAAPYRELLVAGIDWGFGGVANTVLVIGHIDRHRIFRIVRLQRWRTNYPPQQLLAEIAQICNSFRIRFIAADGGGGGRMNNRLLLTALNRGDAIPAFYSVFYSAADQQPLRDGALWQWTVDRSSTIGTMFGRVKSKQLLFPRLSESSSFLDEFVCVVADYDETNRRVKYIKADNHRDDAMHATNYAELVALRMPPL